MREAFEWLASFFNKHYRRFFEKKCKMKVEVETSDVALTLRFKGKGLKERMEYALITKGNIITPLRNGNPFHFRFSQKEMEFAFSESEIMKAFHFIVGKALEEAICRSLCHESKGIFSHISVELDETKAFYGKEEIEVAPRIRGNKILLITRQNSGRKKKVVGMEEIPLKDFRPFDFAKRFALLSL